MIAVIISFFVAFLSFNFFMMSYQINGINRLVYGAPLSIYETAIILYEIDENEGPCFDKSLLEENVEDYFSFHMPRYSNDYQLNYYYYNIVDHSLDMGEKPHAVEVSIHASLILSYQYQKTMFYEIRSN